MLLGGHKAVTPGADEQRIADWAVSQLSSGGANFPVAGSLRLSKVVSAKRQVVAGTNHVLTLDVADDAGPKTVEVTVWEKLPTNVAANESPLQLTANKLVGGPVAE